MALKKYRYVFTPDADAIKTEIGAETLNVVAVVKSSPVVYEIDETDKAALDTAMADRGFEFDEEV